MQNILYIFISHKDNIDNVYIRIQSMMKVHSNDQYVIVKGGS